MSDLIRMTAAAVNHSTTQPTLDCGLSGCVWVGKNPSRRSIDSP